MGSGFPIAPRSTTCHGNHPGIACRYTNRHAVPDGTSPEERGARDQPEVKRARIHSNTSQEGNIASSLGYVKDDSIMKKMLPMLQGMRDEKRGNRLNPERPRLVAKVCEEKGKGELWLGPLPTAKRINRITETKHSIQVHCFQKQPTEVEVEPGGEEGMRIPGTVVFRREMSNQHTRLSDMRTLKSCLVNSLR